MDKTVILNIIYPKLLSSFQLKMIAIITMIIDHIGLLLFPEISVLRIVGRISFIVFAFLISEGVTYSHSLFKYSKRLLIWSFLSEIPFDLAVYGKFFYFGHQNIFFTLFLGVLGLSLFKKYNLRNILRWRFLIFPVILAFFLKTDYSSYGVLVIYVFYFFKTNKLLQFIAIQILSFFYSILFILQLFAILGFIPIFFYSGKLGYKTGKQLYSFYAIHLIVLYLIKTYLI